MRNTSYSDYCKPTSSILVDTNYKPKIPESFDLPLIGTGDVSDIYCGTTKIVIRCSDKNHPSLLKPYNCTSPMCPECYHYWIKEASVRISTHLTAIYKPVLCDSSDLSEDDKKTVQKIHNLSLHPFRHGVLSFPEHLEGIEKPYDILKIFRELSVAGVAIYHPRRISAYGKLMVKSYREKGMTGGSWDILHETGLINDESCTYLSPHIHVIFSGFIPENFQNKLVRAGFVWKVVRKVGFEADKIERLSSYLLTHAGYHGKSKSYRYFGLMKKVRVQVDTYWSKPEPILCPECGEPMKQYSIDSDGNEVFEGYAVESHLIYDSHFVIKKKVKPKTAKYSEYERICNELRNIIAKKEEKRICTQKKHLMLLC